MSGNGLQPKCSVLRIKRHILDITGRGHAISGPGSRPSGIRFRYSGTGAGIGFPRLTKGGQPYHRQLGRDAVPTLPREAIQN